MSCSARLSCRSPPRFSRCRTVHLEPACSGLTPARAANAASFRPRSVWEKRGDGLGRADGSDTELVQQSRREGGDQLGELLLVRGQCAGRFPDRQRQSAALAAADLLLIGVARAATAAGDQLQVRIGHRPAQFSVGVVTGERQRPRSRLIYWVLTVVNSRLATSRIRINRGHQPGGVCRRQRQGGSENACLICG